MRKGEIDGFIDRVVGWGCRSLYWKRFIVTHFHFLLVSFELSRMCHRETRSGRSQRAFSMISMDSFPCRIKSEMSSINDTIYLCNFRVSVDGDWLCLKELHELQSCEYPSRPAFLREEYGWFVVWFSCYIWRFLSIVFLLLVNGEIREAVWQLHATLS